MPEDIEDDRQQGNINESEEKQTGGGGPLELGKSAGPRLGEGDVGGHGDRWLHVALDDGGREQRESRR